MSKGYDLTVRELALLGQMKEAAVRNSLSKERIAIERGEIDHTAAVAWLNERRDFVSTRMEEGHQVRWIADSRIALERGPFAEAFGHLLKNSEITAAELARKAQVPENFVAELAAGRPSPDLAALRRIGEALDLDAPHFVGIAVQTALRG